MTDIKETTTGIGVLEWNMEDTNFLCNTHLEQIRPTTKEDLEQERIASARLEVNLAHMEGAYNDYIKDAMIYVASHVLRTAYRLGLEEGPVALYFIQKTLMFDVYIQCDLYKVQI